MARKPKTPPIPEQALRQIREAISSFADPALSTDVRGRFCYVSHHNQPLSRLGYRQDDELWDFAIYKYSSGTYSNSGTLLPDTAPLLKCIRITLHAYELM